MADDDLVLTTSAGDFRRAPALGSLPSRVSTRFPNPAVLPGQYYMPQPSGSDQQHGAQELTAIAQVYRRTYSWAQSNGDAQRGAVITLMREPTHVRFSEEDLERGLTASLPEACTPIPSEMRVAPPLGSSTQSAYSGAAAAGLASTWKVMHSVYDEEHVLLHSLQLTEVQQPLLGECAEGGGKEDDALPEHRALQRRMRIAMVASLIVNVSLLVSKIVAYTLSRSKSVLASSADSFVDIASQVCSTPCTHAHAVHTDAWQPGSFPCACHHPLQAARFFAHERDILG